MLHGHVLWRDIRKHGRHDARDIGALVEHRSLLESGLTKTAIKILQYNNQTLNVLFYMEGMVPPAFNSTLLGER